ncbi:MAG: sugar phosphate isomerase/epimerase [Candidatus Heimdallarchaeota archaeon]|nr:sugar phosphate isomerase/epimerase [Candidatus Heimdallarchaeota archaeon]MCK4290269.1 sugar phosphate isomerase/epimerase [Candidatus Heimdallarchaeota archaeon]
MRIGFGLEPIKGLGLDLIVKLLRKIPLEHFEFNWRIIPKVEDVLKSLGSATTVFHLPIFNRDNFDFSSKTETYEIHMQEVVSFINQRKDDLNMLFVLAHMPEDPNPSYELMFERMEQIEVPLVLENVVGFTDEQFLDFYHQAKDQLGKKITGHALDISHRYVNDWQTWLDIPEELVKDIVYVHISDCTKTEDLHLPLGLGEMPFNDFFAFLKEIKYDGVINQELKPDGDQADKIMSSSLHCIKPFSKTKYLRMRTRCAFLKSLLWFQRRKFKDVKDLTAEEIGYDYI